jgi:ArsR family transcriptional regulator, lead/cadmium/zinc/bismuth-responsive transcriptional repressor
LRRAADRAGTTHLTFLLASWTRLTLAFALRRGGQLCVCELGWITNRSPEYLIYHLRALRSDGLVHLHRYGRRVMYELTGEGERLLDTVLGEDVEVVS